MMLQSGSSIILMGMIAIIILALSGFLLNSSIAWTIILIIIMVTAVQSYRISRKRIAESYKKIYSEVESASSKYGFEKSGESGILKHAFPKWSGYSLATWRGRYKEREIQMAIITIQRSIVPNLIVEDFGVFIESRPGKNGADASAELIEGSKLNGASISQVVEN